MSLKIIVGAAFVSVLSLTSAIADEASDAVYARKAAMKAISGNMGIIANMAGGKSEFDQAALTTATDAISMAALDLPFLFELEAVADNSRAKDTIWTDWDGFLVAANNLKAGADGAGTAASVGDLQAAMGALGGACGACHQDYRLPK